LPWRAVRIPAVPPSRQRAYQRLAVWADTPSSPATSALVLPSANRSAACSRRRSNHCRSPGCLSTRPLGVTAALLMPRDHNPQHSPTTAKLCSNPARRAVTMNSSSDANTGTSTDPSREKGGQPWLPFQEPRLPSVFGKRRGDESQRLAAEMAETWYRASRCGEVPCASAAELSSGGRGTVTR
jgi:hypothetical protein